ncbi:MAG: acyl--CoA ligase [Prevotella sp.]|jgi:acyl-CoA synthetase (AMP-forming)/AMP-acid ligase II|nr:acyl--CoA ligase [Prevotella sp.]
MILEDYLERNARLYPQKTAIVCGELRCTYEELYARVCERAEDPDMQRCQTAVCLRAECSIDYLVTYFALHRAGCVVVPLEKDIPEDTFQELSQHFSASSVPENIADILYTTGTTGKSKGVMISHQTIIADAENLISGQGFTHDLAFIVNGPLNHIGSLSKIYPVIMLGATLILVDGMKDLNAFWKAFDYPALKVATFLVPASIRILIQFSPEQLAAYAEKIDFIETGAAAISQADMETLCRLLPKSRLYNTYASTETGIISTYNFNDGKCVAGCLGRPMPHSQVFITSEGHIACKGDTLMSGYVGDPERTATVLRDGVVYTSDIGRIDEKGMLHLSGREDDVINVGGFKVAPTEVEDAAMAFPDIQDCICISVEHKIMGRALKLLVVMKDGRVLNKRALAQFLKNKLETYKIPTLYEQTETVKRTFNGKLDRKFYQR